MNLQYVVTTTDLMIRKFLRWFVKLYVEVVFMWLWRLL